MYKNGLPYTVVPAY